MQTFANLPAIEEHGALSFVPTAHMMTCGLFSNMFLCCIFIVQCFPASLRITHIIKEMFVYIYIRPNVHVYYIYMYIIIYTVFPCLQDLARLKIAFYILAHVPKSLLDPALYKCTYCYYYYYSYYYYSYYYYYYYYYGKEREEST